MTKVFVHGNPETAAIWQPLVAELNRRGVDDIVTLTPPGFGAASPDGWEATQASYLAWLVGELRSIGGPIDLVGHDWGAGHTYGIVAHHRDLVSSWAADCGGLLHPDYVWHDAAQGWQTAGVGEEMVAAMAGLGLADKVAMFGSFGMSAELAAQVAPWVNEDMGRCILALYRSAAQPAVAQLGQSAFTGDHARGLVIVATEDPYVGTPEMAEEVAARLGASSVRLPGRGHWWMLEDPAAGADALIAHWAAGAS